MQQAAAGLKLCELFMQNLTNDRKWTSLNLVQTKIANKNCGVCIF